MNNRIEIEAECCYVGEVEEVGSNGFRKRTIVLKEQGDKFAKYLAFTLKKDNCDLVNETYKNRKLKVTGFVESRDWTDPKTGKVKFFTDVTATKVVLADGADVPAPAEPEPDRDAFVVQDDMPF